jgi:hypothetical protein
MPSRKKAAMCQNNVSTDGFKQTLENFDLDTNERTYDAAWYLYDDTGNEITGFFIKFTDFSSITVKAAISESGQAILMFKEDDGKKERNKQNAQYKIKMLLGEMYGKEKKLMDEKFSSNPRSGSLVQLTKNFIDAKALYEVALLEYNDQYTDKQ